MRLPAGVRDWLPHELTRKRDVELVIRAVFGRWAYEEVQTPTFERFDVLEKGLGSELVEQAYRFSDRRATALALRPEMTTPIARWCRPACAKRRCRCGFRMSRRFIATTTNRKKADCAS